MKPLPLLVAAALAALVLLAPRAWSLQDDAAAAEGTVAAAGTRWEYRVVGLTDLHSSTLDYLKGALTEKEGGLLGLAKAADDQLAAKTQDLLNSLGAEGWELIHYSSTSLILMRPAR